MKGNCSCPCTVFSSITSHLQTVESDDQAKLGKFPDPAPKWLGNILAWVITLVSGWLEITA